LRRSSIQLRRSYRGARCRIFAPLRARVGYRRQAQIGEFGAGSAVPGNRPDRRGEPVPGLQSPAASRQAVPARPSPEVHLNRASRLACLDADQAGRAGRWVVVGSLLGGRHEGPVAASVVTPTGSEPGGSRRCLACLPRCGASGDHSWVTIACVPRAGVRAVCTVCAGLAWAAGRVICCRQLAAAPVSEGDPRGARR